MGAREPAGWLGGLVGSAEREGWRFPPFWDPDEVGNGGICAHGRSYNLLHGEHTIRIQHAFGGHRIARSEYSMHKADMGLLSEYSMHKADMGLLSANTAFMARTRTCCIAHTASKLRAHACVPKGINICINPSHIYLSGALWLFAHTLLPANSVRFIFE